MLQEINFQQDFNGNGVVGASTVITLSISPDKVLEDGAADLIYTFTRTGPTNNPLTVSYGLSGSATLGVDYSGIAAVPAAKSISFAAGSATATVTSTDSKERAHSCRVSTQLSSAMRSPALECGQACVASAEVDHL